MVMWECVRDLLDQRPEAQSLAFRFMAALARGQLDRLGPLEHGPTPAHPQSSFALSAKHPIRPNAWPS